MTKNYRNMLAAARLHAFDPKTERIQPGMVVEVKVDADDPTEPASSYWDDSRNTLVDQPFTLTRMLVGEVNVSESCGLNPRPCVSFGEGDGWGVKEFYVTAIGWFPGCEP